MGEKLTKADVKKIEEEIEHRKLVLRPELIQAVKEARAQGDLSENFEYYAAKREKNRNESRIGYLERMLKFATIIEDRAAADEVGLNKMVEVYFVDEDESERYKVVTSIRSETTEGRISIESPLGKALLGHKVGDRVQVSLPQGGYEVEIRSIAEDHSDDAISSF
ncbi:transcription elongation factor GreA [Stomatobaculum longum]|jgi:transcription elongation factor greA|uniref:transcription elongation factor GreA n=1 Tax=Stomatobaculum longum TaxID=796942 RepID=UPI0028045E07|nr:transcription elongation factor GreA [Stomatobaculum longum]